MNTSSALLLYKVAKGVLTRQKFVPVSTHVRIHLAGKLNYIHACHKTTFIDDKKLLYMLVISFEESKFNKGVPFLTLAAFF